MNNKIKELIQDFEKQGNKILYLSTNGSKLHGTDNENSDTDYFGIFLPSKTNVLMGNYTNTFSYKSNEETKNTKYDVDLDLHSIQKFLMLLGNGDMQMMELLFSTFSNHNIIKQDEVFVKHLQDNYLKYLTKDMRKSLSFIGSMSTKYNIRGTKFLELQKLEELFKSFDEEIKLIEYFDVVKSFLKENSFLDVKFVKMKGSRENKNKEMLYLQINGKKFVGSEYMSYMNEILEDMLSRFSSRAKEASKEDDNLERRSIAHAFRISIQLKEILKTNFLEFPLKEKEFIKKIKDSSAKTKDILDKLEELHQEIPHLVNISSLNEVQDTDSVEDFVIKMYNLKENKCSRD